LEILEQSKAKHFDPNLVAKFVENYSEIIAAQQEVSNISNSSQM